MDKQLSKHIRFKKLIDMCTSKLTAVERKVIELRYLNKEKITWKQIANIVSKVMSSINESSIDMNKLLKG